MSGSLSTLAALRIFARLAWRRFRNQAASLSQFRKPSTSAEEPRGATVHQAARQSRWQRLFAKGFPTMAFLGILMFVGAGVSLLRDATQVQDMERSQVIVLMSDHYQQLRAAAVLPEGAARSESLRTAARLVLGGEAGAMSSSLEQVVLDHLETHGIEGFRSATEVEEAAGVWGLLSPTARQELTVAWGLYLLALNFAAFGLACGRYQTQNDGSAHHFEWLTNFPLPRGTLVLGKLIEYLVGSPMIVVNVFALLVILLLAGVNFGTTLVLATLSGFLNGVTLASLRLLFETVTRRMITVRYRVILQTVLIFSSNIVAFLVVGGLNTEWLPRLAVKLAACISPVPFAMPLSLGGCVAVLEHGQRWHMMLWAPGISLALASLSIVYGARALRMGWEVPQAVDHRVRGAVLNFGQSSRLHIMVRKELLQWRRQPIYAISLIAGPLVLLGVVGSQYAHVLSTDATFSVGQLCQAIFAAVAYLLMCAAPQTLTSEFRMAWLLQSQPVGMADLVREKSRVYSGLAVLLAVPMMVATVILRPADGLAVAVRAPFLLVSVWNLAGAFFGTAALNAYVTNQGAVKYRRGGYFLPFLMAASVAGGLGSGDLWLQLSSGLSLLVLNLAIRERLVRTIKWLSEPERTPTIRLDLFEATLALLSFTLIQQMVSTVLSMTATATGIVAATSFAVSYSLSALLVWSCVRRWIRRDRLATPASSATGPLIRPTLIASLSVVVVATMLVLAYRRTGMIDPSETGMVLFGTLGSGLTIYWSAIGMVAVIVFLAPVFEEWLFRGLLYRGLRSVASPLVAAGLASLVFTTCHPLVSGVGVLILAITNHWLISRTGKLAPAVAVHMLYNATVVLMWNLPLDAI